MRDFKHKNALVTGAASGIGRAIATALAKQGANLWLVDKDAAGLSATAASAKEAGVNVQMTVCDLADPRQITAASNRPLDMGAAEHPRERGGHRSLCARCMRSPTMNGIGVRGERLRPSARSRAVSDACGPGRSSYSQCVQLYRPRSDEKKAATSDQVRLVGFTEALRSEYANDRSASRHCARVLCDAVAEKTLEPSGGGLRMLCTTADKVRQPPCGNAAQQGCRGHHALARVLWWLCRLDAGIDGLDKA